MSKNAQDVYATLQQAGLPAGAAAGVVGNLVYESGSPDLPTHAVGDNGSAHGIGQWHPDRWANLLTYAKRNGGDPYALPTQVGFAIQEAKGTKVGNRSLWDILRNTSDPFQASKLWMTKFERPSDQSDAAALKRMNAGKDALGGGSGSAFDLSKLTGAAADAVKSAAGAAGGLLSWPESVVSGIGQLGTAAQSAGAVFDHLMWWFNPGNQVRVLVGTVSVVLMFIGLLLLAREVKA
jgi:hypothetical protein